MLFISLLHRHSLGLSRNLPSLELRGGRLRDEPKECLRWRLVFNQLDQFPSSCLGRNLIHFNLTFLQSSLQASFFRRRVGIRAAFEVLLQIQDPDSDVPL